MDHFIQSNPFILSKHSVHIIPALCISIIILIVGWYINRLVKKIILQVGKEHNLEDLLIDAIQKLAYMIIYALTITLVLENLHIQMSALFGTLGAMAIGIGFALQKALANMTSGMFLLFYKPFFIGDYIISDKPLFEGKIIDINLRVTTLEYQGNLVLVPNHTLYAAVVTIKKQE